MSEPTVARDGARYDATRPRAGQHDEVCRSGSDAALQRRRKLGEAECGRYAFGRVSGSSEREHPRYAHEAAVTFHLGASELQGRTRNVSRGGLCAQISNPVSNGTQMKIGLQLVFDEETQSEPLLLPSRVAWCTPLDGGYQIGVSFMPLDAEQLEYLTLFLKYLDDGNQRERPFARAASVDERFR